MAHVYADRVKETTTTTGTGALTLAGAATNYRAFSAVMSANDTCHYCIVDSTNSAWEVGLGTYNTTLARTTVLASTNGGAAVDFSAGTKDVFIVSPARVFGGKQTIWIPAGAMVPRTTNGAAWGASESSTNKVMNQVLDFDTTTQEYAQFTVAFPKSWNLGTVTAEFYWTAASSSGGVVWGLQGVAVSNDDVIDAAFGTAQEVTDTLIATLDLHLTSATSAITIAGTPADGDIVYFQVYRKPSDGGDTLAADARLIGVKLSFTINQLVDD